VETLRRTLDEGVKILEHAIAEARTLTFDLSPPVLYDLGLEAAISWLAEELERRHGLKVDVNDDGTTKPLDEAASAVTFRAIRELLMNVVKHANAPRATVTLTSSGGHLEVEVRDEGVGFDVATGFGHEKPGFGLLSVRQQLARLGGLVELESEPGRGTRARMRVALNASPPNDRRPSAEAP
jgi:signal transduction histidine kinase